MGHQTYKNEDTEIKYLSNIKKKNRIVKVKNAVLELEKSFKELSQRELKIEKSELERKKKNYLLTLKRLGRGRGGSI